MTKKRQQRSKVTPEDVLQIARAMWRHPEYNARAGSTEDSEFITYFGCPVGVSLTLWSLLDQHDYIPDGGQLEHMLWTLLFLKTYAKLKVLCVIAGGVDKDTYMKWVWQFLEKIVMLQEFVVSFALTCTVLLSILFSQPVSDCLGNNV